MLPCQVGRIWNQTQLLGTSRQCSCAGVCHRFSLETSQSPLSYLICRLRHYLFSNDIISSARTSLPWRGGGCKGTLLSTDLSDRIPPPHNSGYIPSMQCLVCPTISPVNCLLLIQLLPYLCPVNPLMETWKCTPKISAPYSIVYHCCTRKADSPCYDFERVALLFDSRVQKSLSQWAQKSKDLRVWEQIIW